MAKGEVVFDLFQGIGEIATKTWAITCIDVDGKEVPLRVEVPRGHPNPEAYRCVLEALAEAITAEKVRDGGPKGWIVESNGTEAEIGDACAYSHDEVDRPDLISVVLASRSMKNIWVPRIPDARLI